MFEEKKELPKLYSLSNFALALLIQLVFFFLCWWVARPIKEKPEIKPFTVVLPPEWTAPEPEPEPKPEHKPEPPKPKPEPPKPEPPKPKPADALVKEHTKTNKVEKVEKKKEPPKPEPPKKSAKELREERMRKMREAATTVKPKTPPVKIPPAPANPRAKPLSEKEILDLLNKGAKAGEVNSIPSDELSRQMSLIYDAFYSRWVPPAYSPSLREMLLSVTFDNAGNVVKFSLSRSSGDAAADSSVRRAAALVKHIPGLTPSFLRAHRTVTIRFTVQQQ